MQLELNPQGHWSRSFLFGKFWPYTEALMDPDSASFGAVLKAWFKANDWPQSVPEKLAKERGNKTGPWASQISHAMNDKHQPKVPFFLSLAWFNEQITTRNVAGLTDRKLVDQIKNGQPLCHDNGEPYSAADFFQLFAGLIPPPTEFSRAQPQLTEEDVQEWTTQVREAFRQLCLKHMIDRGEAWAMLSARMIEIEAEAGNNPTETHDCLSWMQEVVAGIREPTVDEAIRQAKRWQETKPFQRALEELLGAKKPLLTALDERRSKASPSPFPTPI